MKTIDASRGVKLTGSGKALVVTLLFRLFFGGYLAGMDQYAFNDLESALTVLVIYGLLGFFAALFILGKRYGLLGIIGLDVVFIILQSAFIVISIGQIADAGMHDPLANWWATLLMFLFSLMTLLFSIRTYREAKHSS
ncbi:TPA: hypothetical protein HA273_02535 [Candidatus Bathyarchaeota archaeon]|nr:hypothetical protein [Candidatus Bathyarchaeota archaeon]